MSPERGREDSRRLSQEARLYRSLAHDSLASPQDFLIPFWRRSAYLLIILAAVASATALAISSQFRRDLLRRVAGLWVGVAQEQQVKVYPLPPPPPRELHPRVLEPTFSLGGAPAERPAGSRASPQGTPPRVFIPPSPEAAAVPSGRAASPAPDRSAGNRKAYGLLRSQVPFLAEIVEGKSGKWKFLDWKPLRDQPPEFLIDVRVQASEGGGELHLVWSVNIETGTVRPLSQAARDLSRAAGPVR